MNATMSYLRFGKKEFSVHLKISGKTHKDLVRLKSKVFILLKKQDIKSNKKKIKKLEHKTASPAKQPKCRYDFVAFTFVDYYEK